MLRLINSLIYLRKKVLHEIGHYVDEMAYPGGVPNNAYLRQLGKPSKYRPFEKDFKNRPLVNNTTKDKNKELV